MIIETYSSDETKAIGTQIARDSSPGDIIGLVGDLGVGKTIFSKGFAEGLGIQEPITSPTFTIINEYNTASLPFYHFDVYRISHVDEMDEIGYEDYFFDKGICLIEWANRIKEIIPNSALWVMIDKDLEKGLDYRRIEIIKRGDMV